MQFKKTLPLALMILTILMASCEPRPDVKQEGSDLHDTAVSSPGGNSLLVLNPWSSMGSLGAGVVSQLGLIMSALLSYITQIFPILQKIKDQLPPLFRLPINSYLEYYNVTSMSSVSDQTLRYLSLDTVECRYRTVCELFEYISKRVPIAENLVNKVSPVLSLNPSHPYSRALSDGLTNKNCSESYASCPKSPFFLLRESFRALNL